MGSMGALFPTSRDGFVLDLEGPKNNRTQGAAVLQWLDRFADALHSRKRLLMAFIHRCPTADFDISCRWCCPSLSSNYKFVHVAVPLLLRIEASAVLLQSFLGIIDWLKIPADSHWFSVILHPLLAISCLFPTMLRISNA